MPCLDRAGGADEEALQSCQPIGQSATPEGV
jgi:hypothetical protein